MGKYKYIFLLSLLMMTSCSPASPQEHPSAFDKKWVGNYKLSINYGKNAANQGMVVDESLNISKNSCAFDGDGYQTYFSVQCIPKIDEKDHNILHILYRKLPNNSDQNISSVAFNNIDDMSVMFDIFSPSGNGAVAVKFYGYNPLDKGSLNGRNVYFCKDGFHCPIHVGRVTIEN